MDTLAFSFMSSIKRVKTAMWFTEKVSAARPELMLVTAMAMSPGMLWLDLAIHPKLAKMFKAYSCPNSLWSAGRSLKMLWLGNMRPIMPS